MRHTTQLLLILTLPMAAIGCNRSSGGSADSSSLFTDASVEYSPDDLVFTLGEAGGPFVPDFDPGTNSLGFPFAVDDLNFGITPDLPDGIGFDSTDGAIAGSANEAYPLINHTVTAYDGDDELASTQVSLRVFDDGDGGELRSVWVGGHRGIVVHERDSEAERLIPLTVRRGRNISDMVAMPGGDRVYISEDLSGKIVTFAVNSADQLPDDGTVVANLPGVVSLAVVAGGARLLALDITGSMVAYAIDASNGDLTPVSTVAAPAGGVATLVPNPAFNLVYVPTGNTVWVYRTVPVLEFLEEFGLPDLVFGLVLDDIGRHAYASLVDGTIAQYKAHTLAEIAAGSQAFTALGTPIFEPGVSSYQDAATMGERFFLLTSDPGQVTEYAIDAATGELSSTATQPVDAGSVPITLHAVGSTNSVVVVDLELIYYFTGATQLGLRDTNMVRNAALHVITLEGSAAPPLGPTQWLFAIDDGNDTVDVYQHGLPGIQLVGQVSTAAGPTGVVLDARNEHAYVVCEDDDVVQVFDFDDDTGILSLASSTSVGNAPAQIVLDRSERYAYVLRQDFEQQKILSLFIEADGSLTPLSIWGGTGSPAAGITIDPLGSYLYIFYPDYAVWTAHIELATGDLFNPFWQYGFPNMADAATIAPSARFAYVADPSAGEVRAYSRRQDGRFDPLQTVTAGTGTSSLVIDPFGYDLYAVNPASHDVSAYALDLDSGLVTERAESPFPTTGEPTAAAIAVHLRRVLVSMFGDATGIALFAHDGIQEGFEPTNVGPRALTANSSLSD